MPTDVIRTVKELKQSFFRCFMVCCIIVAKCSYIMYFMIIQANFNIYYGIMCGIQWYITDYTIFLCFLNPYESAPY